MILFFKKEYEMLKEIKIHVYVNTSQYSEVHEKIRPHFKLIIISFYRKDELVMPKIIVEHTDGKKDPPYHGFHGIDEIIKKYSNVGNPPLHDH